MAEIRASEDLTDEELLSRVAGGDTEAFASFYDRHEALWYGLALRIVADAAEAEDVLQEAVVLVWERAPQYDPRQGKAASWAVTVVRHKAIDRVRAVRRRAGLVERFADGTPEAGFAAGPGTPGRLEEESVGIVRRTLAALPAEQRRAIELAFFGGLSQTEIAEHLGQPLGTVKARIRRGMLAMRDALEGRL